ncbi:shikimate kinase [Rhodovulum imhoffii]|uniref:Shikimate kinase n=1 Tax=Rhodovulum imhoffii TaxID=365340 RepID=A0A2T5BTL1_9RHOB|nr:shikimate kinase [Rhodovulum imhoffii]PTN02744.1 shikimate kinase [Rhodovulum imhoffii]
MAWRLKKTVVMVGMMGAGKTAVGTALARRLGAPFMDSDAAIVEAANMTIPEIFERDGEAFFRQKETQIIARLLTAEACVLSTGGGAYLSEQNRATISKHGVAVWLDAELGLLWQRVRHRDTRPLLRTGNPYQTLKTLYEQRVPLYAKADLRVTARPDYSIEDMTDAVIAVLETRTDVLQRI